VCAAFGQTFELANLQESYRGHVGELIKAHLYLKNNSSKTITLMVRKVESQIGTTQRSFLCPDSRCEEQSVEDVMAIKLEPGATYSDLVAGLEAGLVAGQSRVTYLIYNRANPAESIQAELNFISEEAPVKKDIFTSRLITIHDVYPNPVTEFATIDYKLHDERVQAKIVIHNILGNWLEEIELPYYQHQAKLRADALSGGIYFYTVYLDNESVMTRKLIVKR
jgi:hypothetical protein